jgi:hypothetical protein
MQSWQEGPLLRLCTRDLAGVKASSILGRHPVLKNIDALMTLTGLFIGH